MPTNNKYLCNTYDPFEHVFFYFKKCVKTIILLFKNVLLFSLDIEKSRLSLISIIISKIII